MKLPLTYQCPSYHRPWKYPRQGDPSSDWGTVRPAELRTDWVRAVRRAKFRKPLLVELVAFADAAAAAAAAAVDAVAAAEWSSMSRRVIPINHRRLMQL